MKKGTTASSGSSSNTLASEDNTQSSQSDVVRASTAMPEASKPFPQSHGESFNRESEVGFDVDQDFEPPIEQPNDLPDFQQNRHPYIKAYVRVFAWLTMLLLALRGFSFVPLRYEHILCAMVLEQDPSRCELFNSYQLQGIELAEFIVRLYVEIVHPLATLFMCIAISFVYFCHSSVADAVGNPIKSLLPVVVYACMLQVVSEMGYSFSALSAVSNSVYDGGHWGNYVSHSFLTILWIYALMNLEVYGKLLSFDFVRAKERHLRRLDNANPRP